MAAITDFLKVGAGAPGMGATAPSPLQRVLDILGSKGGQTAVNALGAGVSAYGASKDAAADRELSSASMAQRQLEGDRSHQLSQATAGAAATPLGSEQSFAQKQALAKALLGGARNFSATPGDSAVAGAMGSVTGGMRLPEGGFDPAMLERLFGDEATLASLASRGKSVGQINPGGPVTDFGAMFGPAGQQTTAAIGSANASELQRQSADAARQRELIMRAIDQDVRGTKQPSKAKSALGGAASGAMNGASIGSIIPGLGTGIGAAIGGGLGFLKGLF